MVCHLVPDVLHSDVHATAPDVRMFSGLYPRILYLATFFFIRSEFIHIRLHMVYLLTRYRKSRRPPQEAPDDAFPSIMFRSRSLKSRTRGKLLKPEIKDILKVVPDEAKKSSKRYHPIMGRPALISMRAPSHPAYLLVAINGGGWFVKPAQSDRGGGEEVRFRSLESHL